MSAATTLRFLRLPEVVELTGMSATTIWRKEKAGDFPRRRKLGANIVAWRSDELEAWANELPLADETGADETDEADAASHLPAEEQ